MPLFTLDAIASRELFPGFTARIVHTPTATQSFVHAVAGSIFPEHHHPHEQIVAVIEGELEVVADGHTMRLTPGTVFVIPPNLPHSGRAITECRVVDTFTPARDDYK